MLRNQIYTQYKQIHENQIFFVVEPVNPQVNLSLLACLTCLNLSQVKLLMQQTTKSFKFCPHPYPPPTHTHTHTHTHFLLTCLFDGMCHHDTVMCYFALYCGPKFTEQHLAVFHATRHQIY